MPVTAVIGAQWGDEGKGKIVDAISGDYDFCVRFNGGNNAGHTIHNENGQMVLHLIPAGIFRERVVCVIGNGVVVHPQSLWSEMNEVMAMGVPLESMRERLKISSRAHVVMPWHIILDELQESARGREKIGTTSRGIGPVFSDKTGRHGIRMGDFVRMREREFRAWFTNEFYRNVTIIKALYDGMIAMGFSQEAEEAMNDSSADSHIRELLALREVLAPYVCETEELLWEAADKGARILLEGAQGVHLDPDFGTYPFVTSSPCTPAGACLGSGLRPVLLTRVIGVAKAYCTRVGSGPFPTCIKGSLQEALRKKGNEYGATTGRPRLVGWPDLTLLRYSANLGVTEWAITKLDVLAGMRLIPVCVAYGSNGKPIYKAFRGWNEDIQQCTRFAELPPAVKKYLRFIEEKTGVPVKYISTGPKREQIITR